jgi:hypothetical protein
MFDILKDNTKFEQLKMLKSNIYKETVKREDKVRKLLNELKNEELISEQQHAELNTPIGSRPGILYGLPKVHKHNFPLRPIISAIGTHAYKLAKFLVPLLRPFSTNYTISDTFMFVKELRELQINTNNVVMASFDVKSLFTNISLDETISIIVNKCFYNTSHFHS